MATSRDIISNLDEDGFDDAAELRRLNNVLVLAQNAQARLAALQNGWIPPGPQGRPGAQDALNQIQTTAQAIVDAAAALSRTLIVG